MYLINTHTLKLESLPDEREIRYGILSHRWEEEEVLFNDMQSHAANPSRLRKMKGFAKIERCCGLAREQGLRYVWVDTCCIDKSSSAELQEAINSMFRWYAGAVVCYAYLSDVQKDSFVSEDGSGSESESESESFRSSQWFQRGWTLQELLAPVDVIFYDAKWRKIGARSAFSEAIESVTRIPAWVLSGGFKVHDPPLVAEIMSWARGRKTTRIEDRAYCLLGLFDVNMPLLYGEGDKAFKRLQEEIIRNTSDLSIFAWEGVRSYRYGLLAESPDNFTSEIQLSRRAAEQHRQRRQPESVTNQGISLSMDFLPWKPLVYLAVVGYMYDMADRTAVVCIFLRLVNIPDCYVRVEEDGEDLKSLRLPNGSGFLKDCPVRALNSLFDSEKLAASYSLEAYKCKFTINGLPVYRSKGAIHPCGPGYWIDEQSCLGLQVGEIGTTHMATIFPLGTVNRLVQAGMMLIGVDHRFLPYCIFGANIAPRFDTTSWLRVKGQSIHNGALEHAEAWKRVDDAQSVDSDITILPDSRGAVGRYLYLARNALVVMADCSPEMLLMAMEGTNVFISVTVRVKYGTVECDLFLEMRGPDVRERNSEWQCKILTKVNR